MAVHTTVYECPRSKFYIYECSDVTTANIFLLRGLLCICSSTCHCSMYSVSPCVVFSAYSVYNTKNPAVEVLNPGAIEGVLGEKKLSFCAQHQLNKVVLSHSRSLGKYNVMAVFLFKYREEPGSRNWLFSITSLCIEASWCFRALLKVQSKMLKDGDEDDLFEVMTFVSLSCEKGYVKTSSLCRITKLINYWRTNMVQSI